MPEIVQDIGAYAGLASVVGLAVLSVLYFSQARDVRRLREWAGRAPERAEQETGIVQPTPGKALPQPQAAAATAVATAGGAATAPTRQGAGRAGGLRCRRGRDSAEPGRRAQGARRSAGSCRGRGNRHREARGGGRAERGRSDRPQGGSATGGAAEDSTGLRGAEERRPGRSRGRLASGERRPAGVPGAPRPATSAASGGKGGPPPAPAQAKPQPAPRPAPQHTQIIPPKSESWHQRIFGSTRNLILAICGVVLLGAGVALALTQISSDDSGTPSGTPAAQEPQDEGDNGGGQGQDQGEGEGEGGGQRPNRPAIDPSTVTVAVLNGTTVPGLAARVSDEVQTAGFEVGTVANSSDQQRAESVILFAPGHEREAAAVSRRLDIAQREPIDAATQGLAGDATVVVVTGADRS